MSNPTNIHYVPLFYKHLLYVVKLRDVLNFKHRRFQLI